MAEIQEPRCADLAKAGFDAAKATEETWEAMLSSGVFVEGEFTFASGLRSTLKADAERLYDNPEQLGVILGYFATFPCIQDADVLLYVPDGMRRFMTILGEEMGKPVAHTMRRPGAKTKYDFMFSSAKDELKARSANKVAIGEDVVTTLGSVAGIRKLLRPDQDVHSLTILLRGIVNPEYQEGLVDHYLLTREIPTNKDEFRRQLEEA